MRQVLKRHKLWANLQGEVKFEHEGEGIGKALTADQETALLAACESNQLLHTAVTLALNTALRKNELRLLRWVHIDLFKRTLTVGKSKTEGGTGREVPLNTPAHATLIRWASRFPSSKPSDYLFPACEAAGIERENPNTERIDPSRPINSWRTAWRAALKRAGLLVRFHDLRHTCITKLAESQASEQTIMSIAGHLSRRMVEHYSHIRMSAKRAALDAIVVGSKPATSEGVVHQNGNQLAEAENLAVANSLNQLVGLGRVELPTSPLSGVRSSHLSYRPRFRHGACRSRNRYKYRRAGRVAQGAGNPSKTRSIEDYRI